MALGPHGHLDRGRYGESVYHGCQYGEIHGVGGVPDFPGRADAGVHQQMVGGGEVDEEDVENEGSAADGLVDRPGAGGELADEIPDGDHGADVDLLGLVAEAPPDHAIPHGVGLGRPAHRKGEGRDHHDGPMEQRDDSDDGGCGGSEGDERHRALVGAVAAGDVERRKKVIHADERADRHEDDAEVEARMREQRQVARHEHVGLALEDDDVGHHRAGEHEAEGEPRDLAREQPALQRDGAGEVEDRDLEEQYPEDEHVEPVEGQDAVEPIHAEQVNGLPAGEGEQDGGDAAEEEKHDAGDGVEFDETLRGEADLEAGGGAFARVGAGGGQRGGAGRGGSGGRGHGESFDG